MSSPVDSAPGLIAGHSGVAAALEVRAVTAGYGRATVLRDVSLIVPPASVVGLLGANGAGKTTLLRVASGLLRTPSGTVLVDGQDVSRLRPYQRVRRGVCLVPEGRGVFRNLSVRDNLTLQLPPGQSDDGNLERVLETFPVLRRQFRQTAGSLSGGQQQMLALARSFLSSPRVVLLDEVSMGLAPIVVDEIFESLRALAASGTALLVVEQYVRRVMEFADSIVLISKGTVTYSGPTSGLDEESLTRGYLGANAEGH